MDSTLKIGSLDVRASASSTPIGKASSSVKVATMRVMPKPPIRASVGVSTVEGELTSVTSQWNTAMVATHTDTSFIRWARSPAKLWASRATTASSRKLIRAFWSIGYQPKYAATQLSAATATSTTAITLPASPMRGWARNHTTRPPKAAKNTAMGRSVDSTWSQSRSGSRNTAQYRTKGVSTHSRLSGTRSFGPAPAALSTRPSS